MAERGASNIAVSVYAAIEVGIGATLPSYFFPNPEDYHGKKKYQHYHCYPKRYAEGLILRSGDVSLCAMIMQ